MEAQIRKFSQCRKAFEAKSDQQRFGIGIGYERKENQRYERQKIMTSSNMAFHAGQSAIILW